MMREGPRISDQRGFSLVELLVVMLIVGILAAIALPAFLGQQRKGQDAAAKTAVRGLLSHVEACFVATDTYAECDSQAELGPMNLDYGGAAGEVEVTSGTATGYTLVAHSRSGADFRIARAALGARTRTCTPSGLGGCGGDGRW